MQSEMSQLAEWSEAVRESSIKRLVRVPPGKENWRPTPGALSFADIAQHLVDADEWLFVKLEKPNLPGMKAVVGSASTPNYSLYLEIIERLRVLGKKRSSFISALSSEQLTELVFDDRFGRQVSVWWFIVRGNLDHEAHHRGQIATYLRILGDNDNIA